MLFPAYTQANAVFFPHALGDQAFYSSFLAGFFPITPCKQIKKLLPYVADGIHLVWAALRQRDMEMPVK
jgi:hypothetical protein